MAPDDDRPTIEDRTASDRGVARRASAMRYRIGDRIGIGGMGEVMAAEDDQIGREVALKRLKVDDPSERAIDRFLREARIQGRLDHPAIVPVYELGRDGRGLPFFAMKKLAGTTLAQILRGDPADPQFSRHRLLRAFADVCLAIELAHVRGVIHRDLKPANIMLGDFGEVYVLDWGIAKVLGEADDFADVRSDALGTVAGAIVGTPGYLAPEQAAGAPDIDARADVYSLGCVLFEILARQPLYAHAATDPVEARPSLRVPGAAIPPELDALCVAATALKRADRIATARELGERVQRYLDGDRDHAARRELARQRLDHARAALADGDRAEGMRAAGQALALDPESSGAAELVTALMLRPPDEPPAELRAELQIAETSGVRRHARTAVLAYVAIASFLPVTIWNGIRAWDVVLGTAAMALGLATAAYQIVRNPTRTFGEMCLYAVGNVFLMGMLTRVAGPFMFVPALTCIVVTSLMAYPVFTVRSWVLVTTVAVGFLVPIVLEMGGYLARTWEISRGSVISYSSAISIDGVPTAALFIVSTVTTIVIAGVHAARIHRTARNAQHLLLIQAWHLRQLLPAGRAS